MSRFPHLEELKAAHKTIFLSSHLLAELDKICADFMIIQKGKVVFQENLPRLKEHHVLVRFDRASQSKDGSISLPYPRRIRGRFVEWLVPRQRLGTLGGPHIEKAEVRPLDLEGLYRKVGVGRDAVEGLYLFMAG